MRVALLLHRRGNERVDGVDRRVLSAGDRVRVNVERGDGCRVANHLRDRPNVRAVLDRHRRMANGLVSGAMLVPAGVWAIHALQETAITYLQATS